MYRDKILLYIEQNKLFFFSQACYGIGNCTTVDDDNVKFVDTFEKQSFASNHNKSHLVNTGSVGRKGQSPFYLGDKSTAVIDLCIKYTCSNNGLCCRG